ncbi:glycogen synthase GlgA [Salinarimonas rosea]|uniref:glycogen synthase GlgA n=1 Tax=Salinarimonas rosea TaxID=552063 RepID=UPI0004081A35|nr:glycogen synthase GlgA [Salinarimonas rosea]
MSTAPARMAADRSNKPQGAAAARSRAEARPRRQTRVLFVTPEMTGFVKAGGLGEVSAALPRAMRGVIDARVLIPGYREIVASHPEIRVVARLPAHRGVPACSLGELVTPDGLVIYVVLAPELFDREGTPYGDAEGVDWRDNDIRFARLGLAAVEIARGAGAPGWRPDLLHLNDWPTGFAAAYAHWEGVRVPSVITIHNLAYQGLFSPARMERLGVPKDAFGLDGVEFHGKLSFLKAGLSYADHVTTVSATYAHEITTPELGCGLDGLLRLRAEQGRLTGIVNGIDASWDPATDPHLESPFALNAWDGKEANAAAVRRAFGLSETGGPLFAVISRLVHQKGVDLSIDAAEAIVADGGQIVVTGRGEGRFESELRALARRHPGMVGVDIGFEEARARRMYAASDFLLMPSRFEPCGLSQMYAQAFASLPIATRTGGLADTIDDGVTGFLFDRPSLPAFLDAIRRALDAFRARSRLMSMRRAAMTRPMGWDGSVRGYEGVYRRVGVG